MKNTVVFGYGYEGTVIARHLYEDPDCNFLGFADNSPYKQGYFSYGYPIRDMNMLLKLNSEIELFVIIASKGYREIIEQCIKNDIMIDGVYVEGKMHSYPFATFEGLDIKKDIRLYAGDIYDDVHFNIENLYGLSITRWDEKHIFHDIRMPYPLPDECISVYEAEEVFEYISQEELPAVINEIYRVLKKGGLLRICVSDSNSPYILRRSMTNSRGEITFDAGAGGSYNQYGIIGGQVYFATYDNLSEILNNTEFKTIEWFRYYSQGKLYRKQIDMNKGYLNRVKNEQDVDDYCIVVDCYK